MPLPSPENLPDPGIEPASPVLAGQFFTTEPPGKPVLTTDQNQKLRVTEVQETLACEERCEAESQPGIHQPSDPGQITGPLHKLQFPLVRGRIIPLPALTVEGGTRTTAGAL